LELSIPECSAAEIPNPWEAQTFNHSAGIVLFLASSPSAEILAFVFVPFQTFPGGLMSFFTYERATLLTHVSQMN
jgi:hypothetical protein